MRGLLDWRLHIGRRSLDLIATRSVTDRQVVVRRKCGKHVVRDGYSICGHTS